MPLRGGGLGPEFWNQNPSTTPWASDRNLKPDQEDFAQSHTPVRQSELRPRSSDPRLCSLGLAPSLETNCGGDQGNQGLKWKNTGALGREGLMKREESGVVPWRRWS